MGALWRVILAQPCQSRKRKEERSSARHAAHIQLKAKRLELASGSELKARESLFSYYRGHAEYLRSKTEDLSREVGKVYATVGSANCDQDSIDVAAKMLGVISTMAPHDVRSTLVEMESTGLQNSPQYSRLKELVGLHDWRLPSVTRAEMLARLDAIAELTFHLMICYDMISEARMKALFKPYLNSHPPTSC
jgi:hypothetical protein